MDYERILVFGAHPDDEFTMAGTMAKLADAGVKVYVATMTNGNEGYPRPEWRDTIVEMRRAEAAEADKVLGVARTWPSHSPSPLSRNASASSARRGRTPSSPTAPTTATATTWPPTP